MKSGENLWMSLLEFEPAEMAYSNMILFALKSHVCIIISSVNGFKPAWLFNTIPATLMGNG